MRQIMLDTETTGLDPAEGHRIIEIGCVEMVNRRLTGNTYHKYVNPGREIDAAAIEVHGITNEFLADKPRFADIAGDFLDFVRGAELVIHNAPFDVGFLNHEFLRLAEEGALPALDAASAGEGAGITKIEGLCAITDTLALARSLRPGQKNDLDSLCRHYGVDNSQRALHGALLDAEILADVYLAMTGGQTALFEDARDPAAAVAAVQSEIRRIVVARDALAVIRPTAEELAAHEAWLDELDKKSGGRCLWRKLDV
ncbi:DNA polymerase III subunit epsilon [Sulfurifustis variabilis]|uniref:DNA polymerase III subunit epsilon n=1 Tax=Sulfurifustis variabilis TaxID=1675686 RepID=A0A1B4V2W0_9GAMM|nr:DNA polymerase III subunit epsilon [Sulfurifustis variabilis]BAU47890.1 DNA polymerase III subunit epsilon [Sulfurifustis variabilis]